MSKELDLAFKEAVKIASSMEEKLPQDVMLRFYAYYKQATKGDKFVINNENDVRSAFKLNAWMQLKGMSDKEAKIAYIELLKNYTK